MQLSKFVSPGAPQSKRCPTRLLRTNGSYPQCSVEQKVPDTTSSHQWVLPPVLRRAKSARHDFFPPMGLTPSAPQSKKVPDANYLVLTIPPHSSHRQPSIHPQNGKGVAAITSAPHKKKLHDTKGAKPRRLFISVCPVNSNEVMGRQKRGKKCICFFFSGRSILEPCTDQHLYFFFFFGSRNHTSKIESDMIEFRSINLQPKKKPTYRSGQGRNIANLLLELHCFYIQARVPNSFQIDSKLK